MPDPIAAAPAAPAAPAAAPAPTSAAAALAPTPAPAPADPAATPAAAAPAEPGLSLPGKDATPEAWAEFYGKLGRPDSADAYELPLPEGDDGTFAKQVAPMLHKHGLSKQQAQGLAADWNAMVAQQQADAAKAEEAAAAARDTKNKAEQTELKTELGEKFEPQMELAKRAVRQFGGEKAGEIIEAIEQRVGYKATMQLFMAIGAGLGEHDSNGAPAPAPAGDRLPTEKLLYPSNYPTT